MNSVNPVKGYNTRTYAHRYNWQHMMFVSKCRFKVFKKEYTREVIRKAIYEIAETNRMTIKEFAFGDDYSHIHMEVDVPNTLAISKAIQILKSYSAYILFYKIPNFCKLYPRGRFWSGYYSNGSVGPSNEETVRNYIRNQDVSRGQMTLN
jgi:REP element-mobilizing transposase RayT